ncbi:hypothetical protein DDE82_000279 [Stemphylium lycopersici]|nr:hypothetical protein DDE82_000279 [Stemphylium lycopersici]
MVSLEVGPEAVRFLVHDSILSRSEVLTAKSYPLAFVKQSVQLPELDQTTAHTLVHYLYTGKYQALSVHAASDKMTPESYKLSVCVYCAAVRYELPGLTELAQNKVKSFGEEVSIFDTLAVARDHAFPLLPEEDVWYPAYIEDALNAAMAEDPEPFRKPDFITTVDGNSKLLQLVWKTVMSNYARTPATPVARNDDALTPTAEAVPEIPQIESIEEPAPVEETQAINDDKPEIEALPVFETPKEDIPIVPETAQDGSVKMEDIDPTLDVPTTPEPFTDELDFKSSKTYQQMGKKAEQLAANTPPAEEPKVSGHVRSDSIIQIELDSKADGISGMVGDVEQVPTVASEVAPLKKNKKKGKKGKVAAAAVAGTE